MSKSQSQQFVESFRNIMNKIDSMPNSKITIENTPIKVLCDWGRQACDIIEMTEKLLKE